VAVEIFQKPKISIDLNPVLYSNDSHHLQCQQQLYELPECHKTPSKMWAVAGELSSLSLRTEVGFYILGRLPGSSDIIEEETRWLSGKRFWN